jgi:hypothetical protein
MALEVHDPDGIGPQWPRLYAGGFFSTADGQTARRLAFWDGSSWTEVEGGSTGAVRALRSWDDGSGPALYVGGDPMSVSAGLPANVAFKLTSQGWEALPSTGTGLWRVNAFGVHDEGPGFRLYAAGTFQYSNSPLDRGPLLRLDGAMWTPLTPTRTEALSIRSIAEPQGRALYLGTWGDGLMKLQSGAWSIDPLTTGQTVRAISPLFDDGAGASVFLSQSRVLIQPPLTEASQIGRIEPCPSCYPNCDGSVAPPVLNVADFICFQQRFAAGDPYANCDGSTAAPVLNIHDYVCFQQQFAAGCP